MTPENNNRSRRFRWPLIIVALLAAHVTLMCWAVAKATGDKNAVVIDDYYNKAVHYDDSHARQLASDALGWQVSLVPGDLAEGPGRRSVTLRLTDKSGTAVNADSVSIEGYPQAHADAKFSAKFDPSAQGFAAVLPLGAQGYYQLNLTARSGDKTFLHQWSQFVPAVSK